MKLIVSLLGLPVMFGLVALVGGAGLEIVRDEMGLES